MAEGDLILSNGTSISPEDIRLIAAEAKKILASESKELMQYEEVTSLSRVSSFPAISQQGTTLKLVRIAMDLLKGNDAKNLELSSSPDAILWRREGDIDWKTLVSLSSLRGDKGDPGEPVTLRKTGNGIEWKYKSDPDTAWQSLVDIDDIRLRFSDLSADDKAELTKIPVLDEVSARSGDSPSGSFHRNGVDGEGNPKYILSLVIQKGDKGEPPVLRMGDVETKLPDTEVEASLTDGGFTEDGRPVYYLNLKVPAGKPGQDGNGAGNVYVTTDNIESGKNYVFQAGADNSANGKFIEASEIEAGVGRKNPDYPGAEYFNDYTNNKAAGAYAHAEGKETVATGPRAHTEGYRTSVYAADAHAEGRETWCLGAQGHVEGLYGISWGAGSHTEGAVQADFEVEGKAILNDEESIRDFLGYYTTRYYPNGEGNEPYYWKINDSFFTSYYTHGAFGVNTHAEGINNIVCDKAGHVEGYNNVAGDMIPGHGQDSEVYAPHVEGIGNKVASRLYATHVGGSNCVIVSGNYTFAHGYGLSVSNDYEVAFGRYNLSKIDGKKVLFSYGIGSGDLSRNNAFSILDDGTVVIPKMEGGSIKEQIKEAIIPLSNKINNNYNLLEGRLAKMELAINDITNIIVSLHPELKVFVVGDNLVMTSLIDASAHDGQLIVSDLETSVVDDMLVFGEYVPQNDKAYVDKDTLYFTEKANVSVSGDTLVTNDSDISVQGNTLTIK